MSFNKGGSFFYLKMIVFGELETGMRWTCDHYKIARGNFFLQRHSHN